MRVHECASCVNSYKKHFQSGFKGILLTLPALWKSYKNLCAAYNVLSHNIRPGLITFSGSGNFNNKIKSTHSHSWKPCLSVSLISLALTLSHLRWHNQIHWHEKCLTLPQFSTCKHINVGNFSSCRLHRLLSYIELCTSSHTHTHRDTHSW